MKKHHVSLSAKEKAFLQRILKKGKYSASVRNRAQVLLLSAAKEKDAEIAKYTFLTVRAIAGIRQRYQERGLEVSVLGQKRTGRPRIYVEKHETKLTALACSEPPEGRSSWTLSLLQEHMRTKEGCSKIGTNTIRLLLKKTMPNPGDKRCGVSER